MVTLKEILQYRIHQLSIKIHELKQANPQRDKNGNPMADGFGFITALSPTHPEWPAFKDLKQQCSHWLTALSILKHWNGKIPTKANFRKELRRNAMALKEADLFQNHLPAGNLSQRNALIFAAYQVLLDTEHDLKTNPSRFAEAEKYAEQRRQEVANAKSAKTAAAV